MPLQDRESVKGALEADVYGTVTADKPWPNYKFGQSELMPDVAYILVRDELFLDGNASQNLSTFCRSWLDTEVHDLINLSIDKNMVDKDE
jgi:glutamate decarboxylase